MAIEAKHTKRYVQSLVCGRRLMVWCFILCIFLGCITIFGSSEFYSKQDNSPLLTPKQNMPFKKQLIIPRIQVNVSTQTSLTKRSKRLPGCIILGVMKGGTSALISYLNIHPQLSVIKDEVHFFDMEANYAKGLEYYRNEMPYSYPDQITIEKTPSYFTTDSVPKRIKQFNKKIKLIITLRNPVIRLISHFAHAQSRGEIDQNTTFEEFLLFSTARIETSNQPVVRSMYYTHMMRWLKFFPRKQIHVVDGDNLIVNPIEEMKQIETFLGIKHIITKDKVYFDKDKGFYCITDKYGSTQCLRENKGRAHSIINETLYKTLKDFFDIYNKALFSLLGRSFNWD